MQLTLDYAMQRAAEDGFHALRLLGLGDRARSAIGRRADAREPAGLRSQRLRRRHRPRDVAGAQHRRAAAAAEPRHPGPLLAGFDLQDRRRHGRARRRRDHARAPGLLRRRRARSMAASSSAIKGGHGCVDMRHAIEKSCNMYFYTVGNMLGVDRIHKWAREAGPGRQERHRPAERGREHRAVDRSGSSSAPASGGTPARPSRSRSARARCRSRRCRWR